MEQETIVKVLEAIEPYIAVDFGQVVEDLMRYDVDITEDVSNQFEGVDRHRLPALVLLVEYLTSDAYAGAYPEEEEERVTVAPKPAKKKLPFAVEWAKKMLDSEFVVLDTETTSLDGHALQVSVIDPNGTVLFDRMVKPPEGVTIHKRAQAIHGISLDMVQDAPLWPELFEEFNRVVKHKRVVIYNAGFDVAVLERMRTHYNLGVYLWDLTICAMEVYAEHAGNWNDYHQSYTWVKLVEAARREGVEVKDAHNALGDCRMTLGVMKALANKADTSAA